MKITLKDGSFKEYEGAMMAYDIARDISDGLARAACACEINGVVSDLRTEISEDCEQNILTFDDPEGRKVFRHTTAHVLAQAVKRLYPNAKCVIGPAIEDGFYYDFEIDPLSRDDHQGEPEDRAFRAAQSRGHQADGRARRGLQGRDDP